MLTDPYIFFATGATDEWGFTLDLPGYDLSLLHGLARKI
jgi:hypothetical protein